MAGGTHPLAASGDLAAPPTTSRNKKKKLLLLFLSSVLLLAALVAVVSSVASARRSSSTSSHSIIRTACSSTLYPDLCFSSLTSSPSLAASVVDHKSVIHSSLNLARTAVQHVFFRFRKIVSRPGLTVREREAVHDCLEMFDETLDEIRKAEDDLDHYPGGGKTLKEHASDLKSLLSAAMTNQESCLDGFSHDAVCRRLRASVEDGVTHVSKMCSNALAMIRNMTDHDIAVEAAAKATSAGSRRLLEEHDEGVYPLDAESGFPEWMSAGDRRLLQATTVTPNVVVALDGSGNFKTIAAAVAAAPEKSSKRYVIRIKAGVYKENVEIPKKKTNIMFLGDGRKTTIITGSKNVVDGATTFQSATVAAVGERFLARDITFQNTAGPSKHQAVALRVGSDFSAFYRCDILAYQDTLYVHSLRQFFRECLVQGTVDFIFGNAAVVLQSCDLQARRPNSGQKNMFTAQGREDPNQNTGISIQGCTISAASDLAPVQKSFKSYLGRPWKQYSRTVIMKSTISGVIDPAGWHEWSGNFALDTLYYGEYQNTGDGAGTAGRVKWKGYRVITSATEAGQFSPANFISGSSWLGSTGFPFSLNL